MKILLTLILCLLCYTNYLVADDFVKPVAPDDFKVLKISPYYNEAGDLVGVEALGAFYKNGELIKRVKKKVTGKFTTQQKTAMQTLKDNLESSIKTQLGL